MPREDETIIELNGAVPVPADTLDGIRRTWDTLGRAGTWWTGQERVAIAHAARVAANRAVRESSAHLPEVVQHTAERVAVASNEFTRADVERLEGHGVSPEAYVEMVGVVARTIAVDTVVRGVGADPVPLPSPQLGQPSPRKVPGAVRRDAFVPMVGRAGPTSALSAVRAEDRAQEDLHGALYLTYEEMGDLRIVKDVPRWQMELAAARTSWRNHCRF